MGAQACRCNVGTDEEEQLKLSRPRTNGSYDFPNGQGDTSANAGISALTAPSASSSHVPGLTIPPSADDVANAEADSAGLRQTADAANPRADALSLDESPNGRSQQLAALKEALLEAANSSSQLPPAPSDDATLLKAYEAKQAKAAQEAAPGLNNIGSDPKGEAACVPDIALPTAANIALAAGRENQADNHSSVPPQGQVIHASSLREELEQPGSQAGCFQMSETSNCNCPLGGNPSLELTRDNGLVSTDVYEPPGSSAMGSATDPLLGATADLNVNLGDDDGFCETSQVKLQQSLDILDNEPGHENGNSGEGQPLTDEYPKMENVMNNLPPPAAESDKAISSGEGVAAENAAATVNGATTQTGLEGTWIASGEDNQIHQLISNQVMFADGTVVPCEITSDSTCHMTLEGNEVFYGRLSECKQKILWSDGDIWIRKCDQSAAEKQPAPDCTGEGDDALKASGEAGNVVGAAAKGTSNELKEDAVPGIDPPPNESEAPPPEGHEKATDITATGDAPDGDGNEIAKNGKKKKDPKAEKKKGCCVVS